MGKLLASINALALAGLILASMPALASERWSLKAIVEAPKVVQTAISLDGSTAVYIVRRDHLNDNRRDSSLVQVNVRTGASRVLLTANWISRVSQVPGQAAWSVLADVGDGVQLYRLDRVGALSSLVVRTSTVNIGGEFSQSIFPSLAEGKIAYGVLDYGWSPDGTALWYSCAVEAPPEIPASPFLDMPTVPKVVFHPNRSELHIVNLATGADKLVSSARGYTDYPVVFYNGDAAAWSNESGRGLALNYRVASTGEDGNRKGVDRHYDFRTGKSETGRLDQATTENRPNEGRLETVGPWGKRRLIETVGDEVKRDLGAVEFAMNSSWNSGMWRVAGEDATISAVRYDGLNVRNGLVKISTNGAIADLGGSISLDKCAFTQGAEVGVCIREGLTVPPMLVAIDGRGWTQRPLLTIDPAYDSISPLHFEPRVWRTNGHSASGFVLYPRDYKIGQRYPTIVVTHGNDADNRFINTDFQWSYPLQVFAERGYAVIYINDISAYESPDRMTAQMQMTTGNGGLSPDTVKTLAWLDDIAIYRQAISELAAEGIIDPKKTGLIGYSRGAQMVFVAVTQTDLFKAASSGEGTMFSPSSYWMGDNYKAYGMLFGGSPFEDKWRANWASLAPAYRATQTQSPVLFQMANLGAGATDFYHALRASNIPTDYAYFPGETHIPHEPSNRLEIMQENLDWFAYWFGREGEPSTVPREDYLKWRNMRASGATASLVP